ncbi:MAG: hypothetical protein R3F59_29260 [Myxococcota bacterium]
MVQALTETRDAADGEAWIAQYGLTFPVGLDDDWDVWERFHQVNGRPQFLVFDRDLTLLYGGLDRLKAEDLAVDTL